MEFLKTFLLTFLLMTLAVFFGVAVVFAHHILLALGFLFMSIVVPIALLALAATSVVFLVEMF